MKWNFKLVIYLILILLVFLFSSEISLAYNWEINDFDAVINIQPNRTVQVAETIKVDFYAPKHGIIRVIPIVNRNTDLGFKLLSITDKNGKLLKCKKGYFNNYISLRIGDSHKTIKGPYTYIIKYKMNRVIQTFQESDELYWNITGDNWDVPIDKVTAIFKLSSDVFSNSMQVKGFVGSYGSVSEDCIAKILDSRTFYFEAANLDAREGLTGVARWPIGIIKKENVFLNKANYLLRNWFIFLPFIVLIYLIYMWDIRGRDPKKRGTIVPLYEPPKIDKKIQISPTEAGVLIDERLDPRDISAAVINLAVKGFLKIKETKTEKLFFFTNKDYEFEKLRETKDSTSVTEFEKELFEKIFNGKKKVLLSSLKNEFTEDIRELKKKAYKNMVNENIFPANPEKVRSGYRTIGISILILGCIAVLLLTRIGLVKFTSLFLALFAVAVSGIEFIIAAPFMPRKTKKGVKLLEDILGFELYIKTAEKSRIEWEVKENIFEKYLPYAMVLNLEKEWANRFEGIYTKPPSWYEGTIVGTFSATSFTNSLSATSSLMTRTFASTYRTSGSSGSGFSGGGFSGGGFGGGGGSSW